MDETTVKDDGVNIFDYEKFRQNLERALSISHVPEQTPILSKEEHASINVFNAGHFAGYWLAWIPAHLIRGVWAGMCSAWERAGE